MLHIGLGHDQRMDVARLPFSAPHTLDDGSVYIVSRPPLPEAWGHWFREHRLPVRTHQGEVWRLPTGQRLIRYMFKNMLPTEGANEVAAAMTRGGVEVKTGGGVRWYGRKPNFGDGPFTFAHGTTIDRALQILTDGRMLAGPDGKLGSGIYGFRLQDDVYQDIEGNIAAAWERTAVGGYNGGCLILFRAKGCVVKRMREYATTVPPGAIVHEGDQYCVSPGAAEPMLLVYLLDGIVDVLGTQLDAIGYTKKYHDALVRAEAILHAKRVVAGKQKELVNKRKRSASAFGRCAWEVWNGELYAADSEGRWWTPNEWALHEYHQQAPQSKRPRREPAGGGEGAEGGGEPSGAASSSATVSPVTVPAAP